VGQGSRHSSVRFGAIAPAEGQAGSKAGRKEHEDTKDMKKDSFMPFVPFMLFHIGC
jgi:hypothetical protein